MKPFFSVIIPALNEEHYIKNILTQLTKQTEKDFEVIVVDANSTDRTVSVVKSFKELPLKIISTPKHNLSYSRNLGAKKAQGKYFFFIDADNTVPDEFLSIAKKFILEKNIDAVIPKLIPSNNTLFDRIGYQVGTWMVSLSLYTPRPFSTGGNMIISSQHFQKTNGFDTKVFVGEDHDMVRRLKKNHARIKLLFNTYAIFSTRRFEKEGLLTYLKYLYSFIYLIIFPKIRREIYSYKMGGDNF